MISDLKENYSTMSKAISESKKFLDSMLCLLKKIIALLNEKNNINNINAIDIQEIKKNI